LLDSLLQEMSQLFKLRQCFKNASCLISRTNINIKVNLPQQCMITTSQQLLLDKEIQSAKFFTNYKKFFVDVKEQSDGERYLKIKEVTQGKKFTVHLPKDCVKALISNLELGCSPVNGIVALPSSQTRTYTMNYLRIRGPESGVYIRITEKTKDGELYAVNIPEEGLPSFIQSYQDLKPSLFPN